MNNKYIFKITNTKYLGMVLVIICSIHCLLENELFAQTQNIEEVKSRLSDIWKARENEIVTAHLKFIKNGGTSSSDTPSAISLTIDEMKKIIHDIDESDPNVAYKQLLSKLHINENEDIFDSSEYYFSPPKYAVIYNIKPKVIKERNLNYDCDVNVFDGKEYIGIDAVNNQVSFHKTPMIVNLYSPLLSVVPKMKSNFEWNYSLEDNNSILRTTLHGEKSDVEYVIDTATGLLLERYSILKDGNGGLFFQKCLTDYPGDIVIPSIQIHVTLKDNKTDSYIVSLIKNCELNKPIPEDKFSISFHKDTTIVDFRKDKNNPEVSINFLDDGIQPSSSRFIVFRLVFIVVGVVVIIIAMLKMFYAKKSPR